MQRRGRCGLAGIVGLRTEQRAKAKRVGIRLRGLALHRCPFAICALDRRAGAERGLAEVEPFRRRLAVMLPRGIDSGL